MLQWSREQFYDEARRFVGALQRLHEDKNSNTTSTNFLQDWSCETSTDGAIYLSHPPIQREIQLATLSSSSANNVHDNDEEQHDERTEQADYDNKDDLLCDDTILQDDDEIVVLPNNSLLDNRNTTTTTEWYFSIVYSDVWQSPVLYFQVQKQDDNGSPCTRSEVVENLRKLSHYNIVDDSWDLLSYDEHPISRTPSFFLHPCRTLERLETLVTTTTTNASSEDQLKHNNSYTQKGTLLLSWMSMILTSVGYSIPSRVFQKLEEYLNNN